MTRSGRKGAVFGARNAEIWSETRHENEAQDGARTGMTFAAASNLATAGVGCAWENTNNPSDISPAIMLWWASQRLVVVYIRDHVYGNTYAYRQPVFCALVLQPLSTTRSLSEMSLGITACWGWLGYLPSLSVSRFAAAAEAEGQRSEQEIVGKERKRMRADGWRESLAAEGPAQQLRSRRKPRCFVEGRCSGRLGVWAGLSRRAGSPPPGSTCRSPR